MHQYARWSSFLLPTAKLATLEIGRSLSVCLDTNAPPTDPAEKIPLRGLRCGIDCMIVASHFMQAAQGSKPCEWRIRHFSTSLIRHMMNCSLYKCLACLAPISCKPQPASSIDCLECIKGILAAAARVRPSGRATRVLGGCNALQTATLAEIESLESAGAPRRWIAPSPWSSGCSARSSACRAPICLSVWLSVCHCRCAPMRGGHV